MTAVEAKMSQVEVDELLDLILAVAKTCRGNAPVYEAILQLDEHMRHGWGMPNRWGRRRQRCRGTVAQGHKVPFSRCAREIGHAGDCDPAKRR